MPDDDGRAEPLAQRNRLLEGGVGARAAVEAHQQAREHERYGSTANDSMSRSPNTRISPVIGNLPSSASSRFPVSSRSATTTYSVPRRRNATRRRSRTARSSASRASGVRLEYSWIAGMGGGGGGPPGPKPPPPGRGPPPPRSRAR